VTARQAGKPRKAVVGRVQNEYFSGPREIITGKSKFSGKKGAKKPRLGEILYRKRLESGWEVDRNQIKPHITS
jgi:hypothetical protein